MTLPNFLGIGAMRCGTSWLYEVLKSHPNVFVPKYRKEIQFFDQYYDKGKEWYEGFFPDKKEFKAVGEVSPTYLAEEEVPKRIKEIIPDCKFIVILRNPVDRAYSQYKYAKMKWNLGGDIWEVMEQKPMIFERGLYAKQLKQWFEKFDKENFLILLFEDVKQNQEMVMEELADFLEVDKKKFKARTEKKNVSGKARFSSLNPLVFGIANWLKDKNIYWIADVAKRLGIYRILREKESFPPLGDKDKDKLFKRYKSDLIKVEKLLGKDLSEWRQ